ncbi:MAG: acyl-CoA/acyl-ACP dehydrogenase [Planctomycetes bacterium]|nr:acyl-CoA/acyl-ACP dehydrogenase [Planctomycetota bacterium]
MHNLQLTEDQDLVVDTVRKFVDDAVAPVVQEADEHRRPLRSEFATLAELGVFGLVVAEANGGAGMGLLPLVAALETVGAQSGSLARLWIEQVQVAAALEAAAAAGLDDVLAGARPSAFLGTEHAIRLDGGLLAGSATVVPGGGAATQFVVAAREGSGWALVRVDAATVRRRELGALGLHSAECTQVDCSGARPEVLVTGDAAKRAIAQARLLALLGTAAAAVGSGAATLAAARKHAAERIAFGKPLLVQEAVLRKLVDGRALVDAARQLAWHAARLADLGQDATAAAMQARVAAVDAMVLAADEAVQIHGGFGYTVEYHVERHYRDGKMFEVLDGGSSRLRDELARLQFA